MKLSRLALLALIAATVSTGCRSAGLAPFSSPSSALPPRPSPKVAEVLAAHNSNAQKIKSFESHTSISVTSKVVFSTAVDGRIVMERPRNFKLAVKPVSGPDVADIGSNEAEYWFWVRAMDEKTRKAIYYCRHEDATTSEMAATLQPEWIVEALGFRVIPEDEMADMTIKPGKRGTIILTHHASTSSGLAFTRETVLSEATHQVLEHRIRSADNKLLAEAIVLGEPKQIPIRADATGSDDMVAVPTHLKLHWVQGGLTLDVRLSAQKVNTKFDDERRAELFVEPEPKGYERFNLASLASPNRGTTVRQTRPAPAPRVKLGEPTPIGADGARRTASDPLALGPDLAGSSTQPERLIDIPIPGPPDAPAPGAANGSAWSGSRFSGVVRE